MKNNMKNIVKMLFATMILGVLYAFAMFQGDSYSWYLFYSYLPVYVYLLCMFLCPVGKWIVTRKLSDDHFVAGDTLRIQLQLKKRNFFPLFACVVEEVVPNSLNRRNLGDEKYYDFAQEEFALRRLKRLIFPWFQRRFDFVLQVPNLPRGQHKLSKVRIATSDLFGIIQKEKEVELEEYFTVFPKEQSIALYQVATHRGEGHGQFFLNDSNSDLYTGARAYIAGDRLANIDWKQTAKQQQLMTKEFEREKQVERYVLFNQIIAEETNTNTFEISIEIALSLTQILLQNDTVHFVSLSDQVTQTTLSKRDDLAWLMEHFLNMRAKIARESKTIEEVEKNLNEKVYIEEAEIIFITTSLNKRWLELLKLQTTMNNRVQVVFVCALSLYNEADEQLVQELRNHGIDVLLINESKFVQPQAVEVKER